MPVAPGMPLAPVDTNVQPAATASKRGRRARPVRATTIADRSWPFCDSFPLSAPCLCRRQARVSPRTLTGDGTKPRATVTAIKVRPGATWPTTASEEQQQQRAPDPQSAAAELLAVAAAQVAAVEARLPRGRRGASSPGLSPHAADSSVNSALECSVSFSDAETPVIREVRRPQTQPRVLPRPLTPARCRWQARGSSVASTPFFTPSLANALAERRFRAGAEASERAEKSNGSPRGDADEAGDDTVRSSGGAEEVDGDSEDAGPEPVAEQGAKAEAAPAPVPVPIAAPPALSGTGQQEDQEPQQEPQQEVETEPAEGDGAMAPPPPRNVRSALTPNAVFRPRAQIPVSSVPCAIRNAKSSHRVVFWVCSGRRWRSLPLYPPPTRPPPPHPPHPPAALGGGSQCAPWTALRSWCTARRASRASDPQRRRCGRAWRRPRPRARS